MAARVATPLLASVAVLCTLGCGAADSLDDQALDDQQAASPADEAPIAVAHALPVRGVLGGYERGRVWGWAQVLGDEQPATVRIEVDGVLVARVVADRQRDDLVQKGLHATGRAGFETLIEPLAPGAAVEAFVEGSEQPLVNGPCVVQGRLGVSSCTEGMVRGYLGGIRDGQAWGWAQIVGDADPVRVRIEVDGEPVATALADRARRDLVEQRLHATGAAGFLVDVGEVPAGATIEAIVVERNIPLWGDRIVEL